MTGAEIYILTNGGVLLLLLGQMLRIERRFGRGDFVLSRLQKHCHLFNGGSHGKKEKNQKEKMG